MTISTEDIVELDIDFDDGELLSEVNKETVLDEIKQEVEESGGVNHQLALSLEAINNGVLSKKVNMRSFTTDYSNTNYKIVLEGIKETADWIKKNIIDKIIAFIKKVIGWINDIFGKKEKEKPAKKQAEKAKAAKAKSEKKQQTAESKFKKEDKVIITTDNFVEAFKKDFEKGFDIDIFDKASSVGDLYDKVVMEYCRIGLNGKFSKFTHDFIVENDASFINMTMKVIDVAVAHGKRIMLETQALAVAVEDAEPFEMSDMQLDKRNYYAAIGHVNDLAVEGDLEDSSKVVEQLKEKLTAYLQQSDQYNQDSGKPLNIDNALLFIERVENSSVVKTVRALLEVSNQLTKIGIDAKKLGDEKAKDYQAPLETLKDEIVFIVTMLSIPGKLETAIGNICEVYSRGIIHGDLMIHKAFTKISKDPNLDEEFKRRLIQYMAVTDKPASDEDLENAGIEIV